MMRQRKKTIITKGGEKKKYKIKADGKLDTGRFLVTIDLVKLEDFARHMFTNREMALKLGIALSTFMEHKNADPAVQEAIDRGYANGCASLRSKQMAMAMGGNVRLLIHLGNQYLGQSEKITHTGTLRQGLLMPEIPKFETAEEAAASWKVELKGTK